MPNDVQVVLVSTVLLNVRRKLGLRIASVNAAEVPVDWLGGTRLWCGDVLGQGGKRLVHVLVRGGWRSLISAPEGGERWTGVHRRQSGGRCLGSEGVGEWWGPSGAIDETRCCWTGGGARARGNWNHQYKWLLQTFVLCTRYIYSHTRPIRSHPIPPQPRPPFTRPSSRPRRCPSRPASCRRAARLHPPHRHRCPPPPPLPPRCLPRRLRWPRLSRA